MDGPLDGPYTQESDFSVSDAEQNGLLLEDNIQIEDLASYHPPVQILPKLQEVYTDRVDPLIKILHLPTFWPSVMGVLHNPRNVSKSLEALVFSFYLTTISFMDEAECSRVLGTQKSLLYRQYRLTTRLALVNARFLSTSSLVTLQAYAMFMVRTVSQIRCRCQDNQIRWV